MSSLLQAMNETSRTNNGALTNYSSLNKCVDLFFTIGSSRNMDIIPLFYKALSENKDLALRILLWSRDIREGAGERETFRKILSSIKDNYVTNKFIKTVPEIGRWDDLLCLISEDIKNETQAGTAALNLISLELEKDNCVLCAKWMPRKGPIATRIRKYLGLTPRSYRKLLVNKSNTVEQKMCSKNWDKINYEHVPSIAAKKYSNTFNRQDGVRYQEYIEKLVKGEVKVNAGAIFPHDVIIGMRNGNIDLANVQWKSLPNYLENSSEKILPVVDVSGSMECAIGKSKSLMCIDVSIALGLYLSERNTGIFKDEFITFSKSPVIQRLTGNLHERYCQLARAHWSMSTDIEKVFFLVLQQARTFNIMREDMPTMIVILSDMEFNQATYDCDRERTNYSAIKDLYRNSEYEMPKLVFWNLNAREGNVPCTYDENGVLLVSGFSPSIMRDVLSNDIKTPEQIMMHTVMKERYDVE